MNNSIFFNLKKDVEDKKVKFGEIIITLKYHDGRISAYSITTTERRNCNVNAKNHNNEEAQNAQTA